MVTDEAPKVHRKFLVTFRNTASSHMPHPFFMFLYLFILLTRPVVTKLEEDIDTVAEKVVRKKKA